MTEHPLFESEPIGNFFYLHVAIFEIPKKWFIIKPSACWGKYVICFNINILVVTLV